MVLESPSYFDEASCAYEFDVRMVATGLVSLEVVWLHTLIHRLEGNNGVLEKGIGKFDSGTVSIGNVDIAFHWNPYLKGTLEYWNAISTELADKMGWSTIDFFTKTRPFVPDSVDAVHFVGTSAMVPVVDEAIEKMGLCPIS
ncbi:hypothetical protein RQP46_004418 [Phenoliferia psychrophenolica]